MLTYMLISLRGDVNITDDTRTTQLVDTHHSIKIVAIAGLRYPGLQQAAISCIGQLRYNCLKTVL